MEERRDSSLKPTPFRGQLSHQRAASPTQAAPGSSQRSMVPSGSHGQGPVFPWVLPPRIALPPSSSSPAAVQLPFSRVLLLGAWAPGSRLFSNESEWNQVMGDASRPSSVLLAALGELSLAAIGRRTSREAGEAGSSGQGVEGGVPSTTDSSTPEGRRKTETKDGLLLRGACETKTMHAKKVFGGWWGRRGRTRNQKTNSAGMPAPKPPGVSSPPQGL